MSEILVEEDKGIVLLIDDEEQILAVVKSMLSRIGYPVIVANDGDEAINIFYQRKDEICCVISDLTMINMNGFQITIALRKIFPRIPVIISSGVLYDKRINSQPGHPTLFLHKPYTIGELQKALEDAIRIEGNR